MYDIYHTRLPSYELAPLTISILAYLMVLGYIFARLLAMTTARIMTMQKLLDILTVSI